LENGNDRVSEISLTEEQRYFANKLLLETISYLKPGTEFRIEGFQNYERFQMGLEALGNFKDIPRLKENEVSKEARQTVRLVMSRDIEVMFL
jgi:hypothetical protein